MYGLNTTTNKCDRCVNECINCSKDDYNICY